MSSEPIVVEQTYKASIAAVWSAITNAQEMRQWFFEPINQFEPKVGFETAFDVVLEDQTYRHLWKITEVVQERRIVYDWRYEGFEGVSLVIWELSEAVDGAHLKLAHEGHQTFPQDDPVFSRESGVAGWTYFIQESLKAFLER